MYIHAHTYPIIWVGNIPLELVHFEIALLSPDTSPNIERITSISF
jgi:hypothetical protein